MAFAASDWLPNWLWQKVFRFTYRIELMLKKRGNLGHWRGEHWNSNTRKWEDNPPHDL